jgi:hypothetical protein
MDLARQLGVRVPSIKRTIEASIVEPGIAIANMVLVLIPLHQYQQLD